MIDKRNNEEILGYVPQTRHFWQSTSVRHVSDIGTGKTRTPVSELGAAVHFVQGVQMNPDFEKYIYIYILHIFLKFTTLIYS